MNTPDIDIERLREATVQYDEWGEGSDEFGHYLRSQPLADAARFLVSLADQDGELWVIDPCVDHGEAEAHPFDDGEGWCNGGGSRVRVWPKETQ